MQYPLYLNHVSVNDHLLMITSLSFFFIKENDSCEYDVCGRSWNYNNNRKLFISNSLNIYLTSTIKVFSQATMI